MNDHIRYMGWTTFGDRKIGFVRLQKAAEMIGVHRNTLNNMIKRGAIEPPQVITSRHKGYDFDYLIEWMQSRPRSDVGKRRGTETTSRD